MTEITPPGQRVAQQSEVATLAGIDLTDAELASLTWLAGIRSTAQVLCLRRRPGAAT
jgi:hypothetical protein